MASAPQKTASKYKAAVTRGTHEFQIVGYSARKSLARVTGGAPCKSSAFQVGGYTWDLVCTFHDKGQGHLKSVTLELLGTDIASDVVATASLRIEDPRGLWPPAEWRSEDAGNTFSKKAHGRSWKLSLPDAFRGHEERYVSSKDRLTILCTVEVFKEDAAATATEPTKCAVSAVPPPTIAAEFHKLLLVLEKNPETSDVTFIVRGTKFIAHRLVLAMRSPVLAAELLGHMRESTTRHVRVHDMSASTFGAMLRFIYSDELPMNRGDDSMARGLLVAADRYDLGRLRVMCENILLESINVMTVMSILLLVRGRQRCRQLEDSCIEYIASDPDVYAAVRATKEYKEMIETRSSFIIEINERIAIHNMARHTSSSHCSSSSSPRPPEKSMSTFNSSEVVRGTHEFRIPNFSSVQRSHGTGQGINSGTFKVGGYDWMVNVYLSGYSTESDENISIFLNLGTCPGTASVKASKRFWIDDPSGKTPWTVLAAGSVYTKASKSWGFEKFITVKSAKSRYMGHDGSLTIHCDVEVTKEAWTTGTTSTATVAAPIIAVPPSNIASHLEQLMVTGKWSNLTFLVEETEIHAHWLIITMRAPHLFYAVAPLTTKGAVSSSTSKNSSVIRIGDMKADVLKGVIHFVYTDELPPVDDAVVAAELLAAARRFHLERMKAMCENLVSQLVTKDNAVRMLELAWRHDCKELKLYCTDFISLAMK